jgi:hypothetical protein
LSTINCLRCGTACEECGELPTLTGHCQHWTDLTSKQCGACADTRLIEKQTKRIEGLREALVRVRDRSPNACEGTNWSVAMAAINVDDEMAKEGGGG